MSSDHQWRWLADLREEKEILKEGSRKLWRWIFFMYKTYKKVINLYLSKLAEYLSRVMSQGIVS